MQIMPILYPLGFSTWEEVVKSHENSFKPIRIWDPQHVKEYYRVHHFIELTPEEIDSLSRSYYGLTPMHSDAILAKRGIFREKDRLVPDNLNIYADLSLKDGWKKGGKRSTSWNFWERKIPFSNKPLFLSLFPGWPENKDDYLYDKMVRLSSLSRVDPNDPDSWRAELSGYWVYPFDFYFDLLAPVDYGLHPVSWPEGLKEQDDRHCQYFSNSEEARILANSLREMVLELKKNPELQ
jgi:hypothetical protein